jgi:hypothetical protein
MADLPKVSPRCEVVTNIDAVRTKEEWTFCGQPSTHYYPTKNGTQSLCEQHAQKHLPNHAWKIGEPSPWSTP